MSLSVKKVAGGESIPVFVKVLEVAQGGFILDKTGLAGTEVLKGTPVAYSESTRKAVPIKSAVMQAEAANNATEYKVLKGHHLIVGDILTTGTNAAKYAITAIDKSNAAYDAITVGTTLGVALAVGAVIFKSSGTAGANGGALHATPNGFLYEDTPIDDNEPVSVVIRGTVYKRRVPNGVHALVSTALTNFIFSESF
jgi:hypothetical protein